MACRGLPASLVGDPQVGSEFKAPGPLLGTFLAPAAGLCGMLPWPPCPGIPEEKSVARPGQRQTGARRTAPRKQRHVQHRGDVVSVLARTVREVEAAARRGRVTPAVRTKFQAGALLLRDGRARGRAAAGSDSPRAEQLKRLADWELLGPLLSSFERAGGGTPACMALPAPTARFTPASLELMPHQGQLVAAAAAGHRTFLLADEPGLGKTAQALLAAEAANAYPLLGGVPNVVKTNWAPESARWTPPRPATVVHGDGEAVDGFADIVVLNYEGLDRHMGWLSDFGFRGMVVCEGHVMKN